MGQPWKFPAVSGDVGLGAVQRLWFQNQIPPPEPIFTGLETWSLKFGAFSKQI